MRKKTKIRQQVNPIEPLERDSLNLSRPAIHQAKRIVVKLGTRVLLDADSKSARDRIAALTAAVCDLQASGREVILVSSGAVGVGRSALESSDTRPRQGSTEVYAAVGQALLTSLFQQAFAERSVHCGQLLVNQWDLSDRVRAVRLMRTVDGLVRRNIIPLLNENDAIASKDQLRTIHGLDSAFPDNDRLAALLAGTLGAGLLVLLTDVAGVFDQDPTNSNQAKLLSSLSQPDTAVELKPRSSGSLGRGGMSSKIEAARIASRGGCAAVIASGCEPEAFARLMSGESVGTWFPPSGSLAARSVWIAFAAVPQGILHLDAGATNALLTGGASLLAAGVAKIEGRFRRGDIVELRDPTGQLIGRGVSKLSNALTQRQIASTERRVGATTLIRRANIVFEPELHWRTNPS